MKIQLRWQVACVMVLSIALLVWPGTAMAVDNDQDGIDDAQETTGSILFNTKTYLPCGAGPLNIAQRNACLSPTSKDIFIYLVTVPGGGFIGQTSNGLSTPELLFEFITAPREQTTTGKVNGLGVGIHVAFRTAEVPSGDRGVGTLGQKAGQIISDDSPDSFVFGVADQGTPSATGDARVFPVKIKNYVVNGGGTQLDWERFIKRTFSHELSHVAALTAQYDSRFGGNHYATGSGVVMDQSVVYNSRRKTFTIYDDYASGDNPCLTLVDTSNPLRCIGF